MEVKCFVNGQEVEHDPYDLDYIEVDIVKDFVKAIEKEENHASGRVEVDLTSPDQPVYNLVNCSNSFEDRFYYLMHRKKQY